MSPEPEVRPRYVCVGCWHKSVAVTKTDKRGRTMLFKPGNSPYRLLALFCGLFALALFLFGPAPTHAAVCPEETSVLYLPSPAGGQVEMLYLPLAKAWEEQGRHKITVNRAPGRGGSYALSRLMQRHAGACAMAALQLPSFLFLTRIQDRMVSGDEVSPVAVFAYAHHALWVAEDSPVRSMRDLQNMARESMEKSGTALAIAGTGSFTDQHLANLALDRAMGVTSSYIPLTGSVDAVAMVTEKRATACWGYALPRESMPGLRPLGVAAPSRSRALSDVPTLAEQGFDVVSGSHFGIAMAANVAERIRSSIAERFIMLMADPALRRIYNENGASPLALSYEDMESFMSLREQEAKDLLRDYPLIPRRR